MSPKVLVVGCGITGSAVNRYLTTLFPALKPSYTFWEKSSGVGGRMITNYLETAKIDSKASSELQYLAPHCDMGAQYLTRSSDNAESLIYSLLNDAGVIAPIVDNTAISGMRPEHLIKTHYVASNGLSSVIDYLSKGSNSDIENVFSYDTTLESITVKYCAEKNSNIYAAVGSKLGSKVEDSFDTVILTLPAPQLLALEGDVVGMLGNDFRKQLGNVVYSSRFAVAFYYPLSSWPALQTVPWSAKYVFDDDVIRYVSIENKKKELVAVSSVDAAVEISGNAISGIEVAGSKYESGPSILVHTSVPFGIEFKDRDEKVVYQTVLDHLNTVLPNLGLPVSHHMVNWRESQISKGLSTTGFKGDIHVSKMPSSDGHSSDSGKRKLDQSSSAESSGLLIVAGDAFTESNFEGCLKSAKAAAVAIGEHYTAK